ALEADVAHHDHLVIALDFRERALEDLRGILPVAGEELLVRARHARGRVAQSLPRRIVTGPANQGSYGFLGLLSRGAFGHCSLRSVAEESTACRRPPAANRPPLFSPTPPGKPLRGAWRS